MSTKLERVDDLRGDTRRLLRAGERVGWATRERPSDSDRDRCRVGDVAEKPGRLTQHFGWERIDESGNIDR